MELKKLHCCVLINHVSILVWSKVVCVHGRTRVSLKSLPEHLVPNLIVYASVDFFVCLFFLITLSRKDLHMHIRPCTRVPTKRFFFFFAFHCTICTVKRKIMYPS